MFSHIRKQIDVRRCSAMFTKSKRVLNKVSSNRCEQANVTYQVKSLRAHRIDVDTVEEVVKCLLLVSFCDTQTHSETQNDGKIRVDAINVTNIESNGSRTLQMRLPFNKMRECTICHTNVCMAIRISIYLFR